MKPLVSICCITYNHEKYISDTIESFLMQETSYPFEIIIHDDASNDNTKSIIEFYRNKHPDIIKVISQKENQYSKGKKVLFDYVLPEVNGKYIAFCEGDDFWKSKYKLEKQISFLEGNKTYSSCFHSVEIVNLDKSVTGRYLGPKGKGNMQSKLSKNVQGGFIHISSLVIKSDILKPNLPNWVLKSQHGDVALALLASVYGKVYFLDDPMSCYRIGVENSIMTKLRKQSSDKNKQIEYHFQRNIFLKEVDKYYGYKYHEEIKLIIDASELKILLLKRNFVKSLKLKYIKVYFQKGFKESVKFIINSIFPNILFVIKSKRK